MLQEGKETNLTEKQVEHLNSLGFKWTSGYKKPTYVTPPKSWDERYQEMLEYKAQHGHVNIPQAYPVLGSWVHSQRQQVSLLRRGLKSSITQEQIEKLKAAGFIFITRKSPLKAMRRKREMELGLIAPDDSDNDDNLTRSSDDERNFKMPPYW